MEIICVNSDFSPAQLQLFLLHDIKLPEKDCLYSIRELVRTFNGSGLLLNELVNKELMMKPGFYFEPNWALWRFSTLQGEPLTISDILENLKAEKLNTGLELVTIGEDDYLNHD